MSVQWAPARMHRKPKCWQPQILVSLMLQPSSSHAVICLLCVHNFNGAPCSQSSKQTGELDQNNPAGLAVVPQSAARLTPHARSPVIKLSHVVQLFSVGLQQNPLGALGWHWVRRVRPGKPKANGACAGEAHVAVREVGGIVHQPVHAQHGKVVQV